MKKFSILLLLNLLGTAVFCQSSSGTSIVSILLIVTVLIAILALILIADNMMRVEAKTQGLDDNELGLLPSFKEAFSKKLPDHTDPVRTHVLTRGFDLNLEGEAPEIILEKRVNTFAVQPPNFRGILPIPKMLVTVGEEVLAGQALFYDKGNPDIKYVAPVSGEIVAINRGAKRSISEVVILADQDQKHREVPSFNYKTSTREDLKKHLQEYGAWSLFMERPFDVLASTDQDPKNIFISGFSSGPLAPDSNLLMKGNERDFQEGINVLNALTDGTVYLGLNADAKEMPASGFTNVRNAEIHWFMGSHPAGNVGIQIHHVAPIRSNEIVWTLGLQEVIMLGRLFTQNRYNAQQRVALTGTGLLNQGYVETFIGANIGDLLSDSLEDGELRIISGDVLTGKTKSAEQFLNFGDDQITVIREGKNYELFGWLNPLKSVPSLSPTLLSSMVPGLKYDVNTNTNGEKRAFVVSGQYEQVLPMDIYPQQLMRAIMGREVERMEGLGILELSEEDIALCEYVCTSKMPLQSILREGLDFMREQ